MRVEDIRAYKNNLRQKYKTIRKEMPPEARAQCDEGIRRRLQKLSQYRKAGTVIAFVSLPIEVDTAQIIRDALEQGKRVAVPRCVDGTRLMEFYYIRSMEDLEPRTFGVLEPNPETCGQMTDFRGSICLVPGLAFDFNGYRLGFGKGYYDRFLSQYAGEKIGIVYSNCVTPRLMHGRFDVPVDLIVTEKYLRRTPQRRKPRTKK